jgi:hypothetical protein
LIERSGVPWTFCTHDGGVIQPEVYKQKHQDIAFRQKELTCMLDDSHTANDKFKDALSDTLTLISKSHDLFESSKTDEKRRLLGFVLLP